MIRDLSRYGVLGNAIEELQALHDILETEFNPLELCERVHRSIGTITGNPENDYLEQYVEFVQDVALVRLVRQISQVESIQILHTFLLVSRILVIKIKFLKIANSSTGLPKH